MREEQATSEPLEVRLRRTPGGDLLFVFNHSGAAKSGISILKRGPSSSYTAVDLLTGTEVRTKLDGAVPSIPVEFRGRDVKVLNIRESP